MTWRDFDHALSQSLCQSAAEPRPFPGTKVGILLMNCLEWLPLYFGILKAGCIAVP